MGDRIFEGVFCGYAVFWERCQWTSARDVWRLALYPVGLLEGYAK